MKYLVENKLYDTEKAEKIITYSKGIKHEGMFLTTYPKYEHTLYKTKKGQFFIHIGKYTEKPDISYPDKNYIKLITKKEAKQILEDLNEVEKYIEIFGEIEEG